jgi:hypothetical protein
VPAFAGAQPLNAIRRRVSSPSSPGSTEDTDTTRLTNIHSTPQPSL